jgi:ribosomal protein L44E
MAHSALRAWRASAGPAAGGQRRSGRQATLVGTTGRPALHQREKALAIDAEAGDGARGVDIVGI